MNDSDMTLRNENGTGILPFNGEGIVQVIEEFNAHKAPPVGRESLVWLYDDLSDDWKKGKDFCWPTRAISGGGCELTVSSERIDSERRPLWLPTTFALLMISIQAAAIHFTARVTMGSLAVSGLDS